MQECILYSHTVTHGIINTDSLPQPIFNSNSIFFPLYSSEIIEAVWQPFGWSMILRTAFFL